MVVPLFGMMQSIAMRHDSAFGAQQLNQGRMGLANGVANHIIGGGNLNFGQLGAIHQMDKAMTLQKLQNDVMYQVAAAQEDGYRKRVKQWAKSFGIGGNLDVTG